MKGEKGERGRGGGRSAEVRGERAEVSRGFGRERSPLAGSLPRGRVGSLLGRGAEEGGEGEGRRR